MEIRCADCQRYIPESEAINLLEVAKMPYDKVNGKYILVPAYIVVCDSCEYKRFILEIEKAERH